MGEGGDPRNFLRPVEGFLFRKKKKKKERKEKEKRKKEFRRPVAPPRDKALNFSRNVSLPRGSDRKIRCSRRRRLRRVANDTKEGSAIESVNQAARLAKAEEPYYVAESSGKRNENCGDERFSGQSHRGSLISED